MATRDTNYAFTGLVSTLDGLSVKFVRRTGGVPRFEEMTIPWVFLIAPEVMRELVARHTRSMDAPPPWNEGDVADTLC